VKRGVRTWLTLSCHLLLLVAATTARADRPKAESLGESAARSLQARDWKGAAEGYRKAAGADPSWLPAVAGIGEALRGKVAFRRIELVRQ